MNLVSNRGSVGRSVGAFYWGNNELAIILLRRGGWTCHYGFFLVGQYLDGDEGVGRGVS